MGEIVTVNFRGDELYGFRQDDGVFVALKPIVSACSLNWSGQYERVNRDPVLSKAIRVTRTPFGAGGGQEVVSLRLDRLNFFLAGIDSSRIKDETTRQKVILYQEECADVLATYFLGKKGELGSALALGLDQRPFPDWPMDEMRSKRSVVDMYRLSFGVQASQWIMPQLGFPMPPPELNELGRQPSLPFGSAEFAQ